MNQSFRNVNRNLRCFRIADNKKGIESPSILNLLVFPKNAFLYTEDVQPSVIMLDMVLFLAQYSCVSGVLNELKGELRNKRNGPAAVTSALGFQGNSFGVFDHCSG